MMGLTPRWRRQHEPEARRLERIIESQRRELEHHAEVRSTMADELARARAEIARLRATLEWAGLLRHVGPSE